MAAVSHANIVAKKVEGSKARGLLLEDAVY
jgi:hypothetical protein